MKRPALLFLSIVLPLGLGFSSLRADTVTLKSGEKVEGKILGETDTDITIQVQVSASIKDERTIAKSEIEGDIAKRSEDAEAYDAIKNLRSNEDHSFPSSSYDQLLTGLGAFAQQYPLSEHIADVKAQMASLQAEQTRVQNGELKYRGQWLSAAEAAKEKYQIEAGQTLDLLKSYGSRSDFSSALNTFDLLQTNYGGARAFPDAVDYVKQFLPNLYTDAQRRSTALKVEQENFVANMKYRQEPQRSQFIAAAQREQASYTALVNNSRSKWKPYIGRSNASLSFYLQQLPGALTSIAAINTAPMRQATALVAQARTALDAKDLASAKDDLEQAATLWPTSEEAKRAKDDLAKLTADAVAAAKAAPTPTESVRPVDSTSPVPANNDRANAARSTPAPAEEGGTFLFSLKGALTVLAVVLILAGVAAVLSKRKPRGEDELL